MTGPRTRGRGTASGAELAPGRRKPRSGQRQGVPRRMDSREFLVGTRRVRRFVPRGSVRELRVRGGLIRRPEGPRRGIYERIASRFGAALDNARCVVSGSRLICLRFRPGARPLAQLAALHGADGKTTRVFRRTLRGTWSSQRGALRGKRFACRSFCRRVLRLSWQETGGRAQHRATFSPPPAKGRPRESSFMRAAFAELSALCLPTGVGARFSGKTCLVFAGRRFCRMFGRFLFGAVLRVFGAACRAFGPQSAKPPFKP